MMIKKIYLRIITLCLISINSYSQYFEGEITYKFETDIKDKFHASYYRLRILSISKNHYIRSESKYDNFTSINIYRNDTNFNISENHGVKYCSVMPDDDLSLIAIENKDEKVLKNKLFRSEDTIEILGEPCIRYTRSYKTKVNGKTHNIKIESYVSVNLKAKKHDNEIRLMHNHITLKMVYRDNENERVETAIKIKKKPLDNSLFEIPEGVIFMYRVPGTNSYRPANNKGNSRKKKKKRKRQNKKRRLNGVEDKQQIQLIKK